MTRRNVGRRGSWSGKWQWPSEPIVVKITFVFMVYKNLQLCKDTTRALGDLEGARERPLSSSSLRLAVNPCLPSPRPFCPTASLMSSDPTREAVSKPVAEPLSWNFLLILRNSWSFLVDWILSCLDLEVLEQIDKSICIVGDYNASL